MKAIALIAMLLIASTANATQHRGGSNYNFYTLNGCHREDFGVLKNYHLVKDIIDNDLRNMYANGQRRLRIGIFHGSGISSGTIIDTSSGRLPPQYVENLRNLINSAKQKGFVEIIVALHTIGKYDPSQWSPTKRFDSDVQAALNENWGVVTSIMPALRSTGILFRVDLGNELYLPGRIGNQFNGRTIYLQSMWGRFRSNYHHHESVGFSVRPSESRMLRHARWIYGNHPPYVIDIHAYENAFNVIRAADKGLNEAGFRVAGLIIG